MIPHKSLVHIAWTSFAMHALVCAQDAKPKRVQDEILAKPGLFKPLTEPPCSYCITQDEKGLVRPDDRAVAWVRGRHQGGAAPLRHFLAGPRVLNDTYGLFFYDPDGGYVSAFRKDYGYAFHGWRRGVMVVKDRQGNLFSALTGVALAGPSRGKRLQRIPTFTTTWRYWLLLHPESTAYDLFDGKRYKVAELPTKPSKESLANRGDVDARLAPRARVLGIRVGDKALAVPLQGLGKRAVVQVELGGKKLAVFWYGRTQSVMAWDRELGERTLHFEVDTIAPRTAPFRDRETGTRWSIAGRGIDGKLRGRELTWIDSVACCWYAWVAEHPRTAVFEAPAK